MKEVKYTEWLNAEMIHEDIGLWFSEISFIADELKFFQKMLMEYTIDLIQINQFREAERMAEKLSNLSQVNSALLKSISKHKKEITLMLDGIDEFDKEKDYKEMHRNLRRQIKFYTRDYREVKSQIFEIISEILKEGKQRRSLEE